MRTVVILNADAGSVGPDRGEALGAQIAARFAAAGVDAEIVRCHGAQLTSTAREATAGGADVVAVAGGDGTVSAVASALVGGDTPLGVIPLGTRNHFARDLGLPTEVNAAVDAIAAGRVVRVDVGEVNGRSFINNTSIGLYPALVRSRDEVGGSHRHGIWRAALAALRRFPLHFVRVRTPERAVASKTPILFVGNNDYEVSPVALGQRSRLDGGRLSLYLVRTTSRLRMIWIALRALFQRVEAVRDLETLSVTEAVVDPRRRRVDVAIDGEVTRLVAPLRYRILPGALPVVGP